VLDELNSVSPEKIKKSLEYIDDKLLLNEKQHKQAKEEHKRLFNKNKRVPLTREQRKQVKLLKKAK